ncbi:hypothetical protein N7536_005626 [Penicillium majusculum]|nr:hypothetical protein N7536_005626 [Penicillium majusculum]
MRTWFGTDSEPHGAVDGFKPVIGAFADQAPYLPRLIASYKPKEVRSGSDLDPKGDLDEDGNHPQIALVRSSNPMGG